MEVVVWQKKVLKKDQKPELKVHLQAFILEMSSRLYDNWANSTCEKAMRGCWKLWKKTLKVDEPDFSNVAK